MKTFLCILLLFLLPTSVSAEALTFKFFSPSFTGQGASAHWLTIENQEFSRKAALREKKEAAERQRLRDEANTNLSKFMKNVESRIYAQLSKQLVDNMFGEDSADEGSVTFEGTTISYVKDTQNVTLTILESNGSTTTITVPIGTFTF